VWSLSTTDTALTCHLVTPDGHPGDDVLAHAEKELRAHFGIGDITLQVELNAPSGEHLAHAHNH
jgi:cobalt-zinc-cadmium efflux system protein